MAKTTSKTTVATPAFPEEWTKATKERYSRGGHPIIGRVILPPMAEANGYYCVKQPDGTIHVYAYVTKVKVTPTSVNDDF